MATLDGDNPAAPPAPGCTTPEDLWRRYRAITGAQRLTRGELFAIAGRIQDELGGLNAAMVNDLAARSSASAAQIYGALSAYPHFHLLTEKRP